MAVFADRRPGKNKS